MRFTITEALADLKTIAKRLEAKRLHVLDNLLRPDIVKDPMEKDGGTALVLQSEMQSIKDLERRVVAIRTGIQKVNQETPVTVEGDTKTLAEWLTWRKEVAPGAQKFLAAQRSNLMGGRQHWKQKQSEANVTNAGLIVNIDELALSKQTEHIETVLGTLDGQLSLKNATVFIEIAD